MFIHFQLSRDWVQNITWWFSYIGRPSATITAGVQKMRMHKIALFAASTLVFASASHAAVEPGKVSDRLTAADTVLGEMMRADDKGVPQDLLRSAQCVVIIPAVKKAAFIVGAKYGKGFALCHKPSGHGWS